MIVANESKGLWWKTVNSILVCKIKVKSKSPSVIIEINIQLYFIIIIEIISTISPCWSKATMSMQINKYISSNIIITEIRTISPRWSKATTWMKINKSLHIVLLLLLQHWKITIIFMLKRYWRLLIKLSLLLLLQILITNPCQSKATMYIMNAQKYINYSIKNKAPPNSITVITTITLRIVLLLLLK